MCCIFLYPMLRTDSRFWLVNNREIWSCISRLTSSAWDIKTKERHWWRHNGDSDRRLLSLPLRYDLVTLCLYDDLGQINVIAGILKLRKRFRMSQILFEHGINSLPLVCFRGYGNLSTLSIAIPRLAKQGVTNSILQGCLIGIGAIIWAHFLSMIEQGCSHGEITFHMNEYVSDFLHRVNSPVTQTSPEPTLLSWGGGPREKISPHPWPHGKPGLIALIGPLRPYFSQSPLILLRCVTEIKFAQNLHWLGNWH